MEVPNRAFVIPTFLLAVPLGLIGVLSVWGLDRDYQSLDQARTAAVMAVLHDRDDRLHTRLIDALAQAWDRADRTHDQFGGAGVRGLVISGAVGFIALYDQDHRLYPPDQTEAVTFPDAQKLRQVEAQIKPRSTQTGSSVGMTRIDGHSTPFLCKRTSAHLSLCVVMAQGGLQEVLGSVAPTADGDPWQISVTDPDAPPTDGRLPVAALPLSEPLRGWRIEAFGKGPAEPRAPHWLSIADIVIPLIVVWLVSAWLYARSRVRAAPPPDSTTTQPPSPAVDCQRWTMGDLTVDATALRAFRGTTIIELKAREVAVLRLLFDRAGLAVSRDDLFDWCWGRDYMPNSRSLDQYISALRRKIERDPAQPTLIKTVHGVGYRFDPPYTKDH